MKGEYFLLCLIIISQKQFFYAPAAKRRAEVINQRKLPAKSIN